jgi:hypothetical protein
MEVDQAPKQLRKHAVPVLMVILALLMLPAAQLISNNSNIHSGTVMARDLIARTVHIRPTSNGLAKITLNDPTSVTSGQSAGSNFQTGLGQVGRTAQLTLELEAPSYQ